MRAQRGRSLRARGSKRRPGRKKRAGGENKTRERDDAGGRGDELARGRPGTVRTPPIILFSLPDASLGSPPLSSFSLRRRLRVHFPLSRSFSLPPSPPPLGLPYRTLFHSDLVSLSPFLERVLLSPSISYSIVLSLPLSLSPPLRLPSASSLLLFRRLLALFFSCLMCAHEREYACTECLSLPFSCAFGAPRHCEEAANYRRYTRLTRAH